MAIVLPERGSNQGIEARVLLAECEAPSKSSLLTDSTAADAYMESTELAMQFMDAVLWNRVKNPKPYGAKKGAHLIDIIKAPGQFKGFENYPAYSSVLINRIQEALDIANSAKDKRHELYARFVNAALTRAAASSVDDPSPGDLTAWRTSGHGSPGSGFTEYKTVLGNTFYWVPYVTPPE